MATPDDVSPGELGSKVGFRLAVLRKLNHLVTRIDRLEASMTTTRDEFNAGLAELGTAIFENADAVTQLADRIETLSANDVTDNDLDQLRTLAQAARGATDRVRTLAVDAPEVPTEEQPPAGGETPEPTPGA